MLRVDLLPCSRRTLLGNTLWERGRKRLKRWCPETQCSHTALLSPDLPLVSSQYLVEDTSEGEKIALGGQQGPRVFMYGRDCNQERRAVD